MPNFKFGLFNKGWVHKQPQLVSLDGFSDVNNFVMYKGAIEKVKGWKKLELIPVANTSKTPVYPLVGTLVQSIFEYVKFEEENIRLGAFSFNWLYAYGLPPRLRYQFDFSNEEPNDQTYGLAKTCEISCELVEVSWTYQSGTLIGGPAVRIGELSTRDSATLYAFIFNPYDGSLTFARYINQPLTDYGFILWAGLGYALVPGDVLTIRQLSTYSWRLLLNDTILATITDTVIPPTPTNNCVGMVQLRTYDNTY